MKPFKDLDSHLQKVKSELQNCVKPIVFFDDDCDGTASFVQYYKFIGDGKGVCVKGKPIVEERYSSKVNEFSPDLVVVFDKPLAEQEFFDSISQKKVWVDHHPVQNPKGVSYFNPLIYLKENVSPTSYWVYNITEKKYLWLAMVGCLGDWSLVLKDEFVKKYPDLLDKKIDDPASALFNSKIGFLVKIINFNLKGSARDVMKSVKVLTRIESPYEILDKTSSKGKFIYKKFEKINKEYQSLLDNVSVDDSDFLVYIYDNLNVAISADLSNELLYLHKDKIIIVGRKNSDKVVMSLRSSKKPIINALNVALEGVDGFGGGHDLACGAVVSQKDFDVFLEKFKSLF
ncbi:MAG: DHH family phosphoesterase [Candidatus Woesearchaeota archaeon]